MENYIVKGEKGTFFIPDINFDAQTGIFNISGESYLEDTAKFYTPLLDWLKLFIEDSHVPLEININLSYYNTSSSRSLLDMLMLVKEYEDKGNKVKVTWFHKGDDPEVYDEVEDYRIDTGLKIQLELLNT